MEVANTLAYYDTATIAAVKSFKVQAPRAGTVKLFTTIINKAIDTSRRWHPSLMFAGKAKSPPLEWSPYCPY
jgi:hypothetical protein